LPLMRAIGHKDLLLRVRSMATLFWLSLIQSAAAARSWRHCAALDHSNLIYRLQGIAMTHQMHLVLSVDNGGRFPSSP
jgi:hypothetical protein